MRKRFEQGHETPAWKSRPELYDDLAHVWRAWVELHAGRQYVSLGMAGCAPQPIMFFELSAWLDLSRIDGQDERDEMTALVRALDVEFLSWAAEKRGT